MACGDCFISACTTEAIGLCLMEAMASGVPAVAPDSGGISEVVSHGFNGFLYSKFDADAAVDGVVASLRQRDRLSKNAAASMSGHSWSRSMEELEDAYHTVIKQPGHPIPTKSIQKTDVRKDSKAQPAARKPRSKSPQRRVKAVKQRAAPGA